MSKRKRGTRFRASNGGGGGIAVPLRSTAARFGAAAASRALGGRTRGSHQKPEDGEGEAVNGELRCCDMRPAAEEMFGRFMVAVAGRPLSVHQPVNEIGDMAERHTAEWLARKDKFAAK